MKMFFIVFYDKQKNKNTIKNNKIEYMTTNPEKYIEIGYDPSDFIVKNNNKNYSCPYTPSDNNNSGDEQLHYNYCLSQQLIKMKNQHSSSNERLGDSLFNYNMYYLTRINLVIGIIGMGTGIYYILRE